VIQSGQQILHYRLVEKIGEGGMGVVERFLREARTASALNHPHKGDHPP
jgi:serine/threonine protein kinase